MRATLFLGMMVASCPALAVPDANANGFELYKKGDLAGARRLFEKAQKTNPRNAWAYLNWARVVVRTQKPAGEEWSPGCALRRPVDVQALAALDAAVALGGDVVKAKILADSDGALAPLLAGVDGMAWAAVVLHAPPKTSAEVAAMLTKIPSWHDEGNPAYYTFQPDGTVVVQDFGVEKKGTFRLDDAGRVIITVAKESTSWVMTSAPWAFSQGTRSWTRLQMAPEHPTSELHTLFVGSLPPLDCNLYSD